MFRRQKKKGYKRFEFPATNKHSATKLICLLFFEI